MTITLERPDTEVARRAPRADLPVADIQAASPVAASPFGTPPAPPADRTELPPGVRLVRRQPTAAPTTTLGRKLTMLAPVALLAGVSVGGATLMPHLQALVHDVRSSFGDSAGAATPHHVVEHRAAPKHRAAPSATPDAGRLPQQHQPKHRTAAPTQTDPGTGTHSSTANDTTNDTSGAGDHRGPSGSQDAASTQGSGGKHKAATAPTGDQTTDQQTTDQSNPPASTPPADAPPSGQNPTTPDPVTGLLNAAGGTLGGAGRVVTSLLGG